MTECRGDQARLRKCIVPLLSLVAATLPIAGCSGDRQAKEKEAVTETTAPDLKSSPTPASIAALAPIGRAEFLAAAAAAADEVASGNPLPKANLELADRTFELRLPFGCGGVHASEWGEWSLDPKTRVLRISVRPQILSDDQAIKALAAGVSYDAAEVFWIERPWTRSESCPPLVPSSPASTQAAGGQALTTTHEISPMHTLALVQLFSPDAPRTLRRGARPYAYTGKMPNGVEPKGFHVKLTGRMRGFSDGQPIHCMIADPYRPPMCAAAVEFTKVTLEDANTGQVVAEWTN